jgi:prepilin-type N-terminal cleavage/methylation domain-containing protein
MHRHLPAVRTRIRDDRGFTMIELLAVVLILGIIIGPISRAIIVGIKTTDATTTRLRESNDRQFLSRYWPADVESANDYCITSGCTGVVICTRSGVASAASLPVASFTSTDTVAPGGADIVRVTSYVTETVTGENRLTRLRCEDGAFQNQTPVIHFAGNLGPSNPVTCPPGCSALVTISVTDTSGNTYLAQGHRRASE